MNNQLATQDHAKNLVFANKQQHTAMLPADQKADVAGWLGSAYAALSKDQNLAQAALDSPQTLVTALNEAARQGLAPGTEEYYLTPRKNKGRWEILGITGYQGLVTMMYRSGAVSTVTVEAVFENDTFEWEPGRMDRPRFKAAGDGSKGWFAGKKGRGELMGAFAYAVMKDGSVSNVVIVDADRIAAAKEASAGSHSQYSPWQKHPVSMYKKTAAHDLAKWVPTSALDKTRENARGVIGEQAATTHQLTKPAPQETYEAEFIEAVAENDPAPVEDTGELISEAQVNEVFKRMKSSQLASNEGEADKVTAEMLKVEGVTVRGLTKAQGDELLATLAELG